VEEKLELLRALYEETTWGNTRATPEDWLKTLEAGGVEERFRLFQHLFIESKNGQAIRQLFLNETLKGFLLRMEKPLWRSDAEKKRKVWRRLFCDIVEPVPELDWFFPKSKS